jgi:acyl carrier protein
MGCFGSIETASVSSIARNGFGEKATAIDLGIVLSTGFVAENQRIMDHLMGLSLFSPISQDELFALFDLYCNPSTKLVDPVQCQVTMGLELAQNQRTKGWDVSVVLKQPLFRQLQETVLSGTSISNTKEQDQDLKAQITGATSLADAAATISEALRSKISRVLGIGQDQITLDSRVESYGVDSLVAVELRNWLAKEVDADIAIFELLGAATFSTVGMVAASKSSFRQQSWG